MENRRTTDRGSVVGRVDEAARCVGEKGYDITAENSEKQGKTSAIRSFHESARGRLRSA